MLSTTNTPMHALRPVLRLLCGLALIALAAAPAAAQIDPGMRRWAAVSGHWTRGARDTVAYVDLDSWKLVTQVDHPVLSDPQPNPWFPVAGDWDGAGIDTIKMFNTQTWKLIDLAEGPAGGSSDPQPQPWIPVAGNWDGRGIDTVLVVDARDRSVHRIEEGPIAPGADDPSPNPWRPVIGDWLRGGSDSIAWAQVNGAVGAWLPVAGDWSASGLATLGALHAASGALVQGGPALKSRELVAKGCFVELKNRAEITQETTGSDGRIGTSRLGVAEEWTCCPSTTGAGLYSCSERLIAQ